MSSYDNHSLVSIDTANLRLGSLPLFADHTCPLANGETCGPCRKRHLLIVQINAALKTAAELSKQVPGINTEINQIHPSSIHRIPMEISSRIFLFCVHRGLFDTQPVVNIDIVDPDLVSGRLGLGAVCRTWRQIAWATPQLWNFISIQFKVDKFPARDELVKEWLSRSGQLPLSISVFERRYVEENPYLPLIGESTAHHFHSVIQTLSSYSNRWQNLSLKLPSFLCRRFADVTSHADVLHTLHLLPEFQYNEDLEDKEELTFANFTPRPRDVAICSYRLKSVHIDWNILTHFYTKGFHIDECLELLRRSPQLTHCQMLYIRETDSHFPVPGNPIVHHVLRDLHVDFSGGQEIEELALFFDNITLRSLTHFRCGLYNCSLPGDLLLSFIERSSCCLRSFRIDDVSFEDDHGKLECLLRAMPSLSDLWLPSYASSSSISEDPPQNVFLLLGRVSINTDDESGETFLPELQNLTHITGPLFSWSRMLNVFGQLESEPANPFLRPLKHLTVRCRTFDQDNTIDKQSVLRILQLKRAGIHLTVIDEDAYEHQDLLRLSMAVHGISEQGQE
ncbi:hypothetical protein GALMADRAFT_235337 [Galerina marginata CBS 339.88]|uniref:Uncharacterized protein n=1 Tax=Galerina marginata (strain CBS 339.88) TaxID=685588 RepID=A0A067U3S6_GALM3|nr:hypothetical protein GALMADRAFT_235337 [Galerina marginata CBS 339.88]